MFLMPSRYEPCGLNQLYSLKYGTVPIVRATGGLVDTITDATEENLADHVANGLSFEHYDSGEMEQTLHRALSIYHNRQEVWSQLVTTAMRQDWSWSVSARRYVDLYASMIARNPSARVRRDASLV